MDRIEELNRQDAKIAERGRGGRETIFLFFLSLDSAILASWRFNSLLSSRRSSLGCRLSTPVHLRWRPPPLKTRPLGRTGLELPWLSFGASSLGQEFRSVDVGEALAVGPGRARPGHELHRHLAVLRAGDERMPARRGAPGRPPRQLSPRDQARPVRPGPLRLLGQAGRRERRRQPPPDGRGPPRHHALPRHRVRRDVADRRRDPAGAPQDPGGGQGPVHRRQRLPDDDVPLRPRPDRPRRRSCRTTITRSRTRCWPTWSPT